MKKCTKCGEEKPLTPEYFHRDRKTKTGFRQQCKECANATNRAYSKTERGREVNRRYKERKKKERPPPVEYECGHCAEKFTLHNRGSPVKHEFPDDPNEPFVGLKRYCGKNCPDGDLLLRELILMEASVETLEEFGFIPIE